MDIISLGKAKKAIRDMQEYHQNILEENVELHFPSIDARLDYLEKQFSVQNVHRTLNLLHAVADMMEVELDAGKLKLKHYGLDEEGNNIYSISGAYEKVFDLGPAVLGFQDNILNITKTANHTVTVTVSESDDGITFDAPISWSTTYVPSKRYMKVKVEIVSKDTIHSKETIPVELEENISLTEDNLLLKKKSYEMTKDSSWTGTGSLHRKKINNDEWVRIDRLEIIRE